MAKTIIPFTPSSNANFQFQATLDGQLYSVICTFSAYGQRYYFTIYSLAQTPVLSRPIVGSPDEYDINLLALYFSTPMVYRASTASFEIGS